MTSVEKSQRHFVVALSFIEVVICGLFCIFVRYDDNLIVQLTMPNMSQKYQEFIIEDENYPRE